MYTYTLEMTFAAAFLCLSLFTHCEQIRIMFPTEKHEKLGGKTSFQTIVGGIWQRQNKNFFIENNICYDENLFTLAIV